MGFMTSATLEAASEAAALELFHSNGWTDGLPVVIPTPERVEAMLAWSQGLDGDIVLGEMGPAGGEATVAKLAVNAVMAGCLPEYFPVVLAATEAVLDPAFAHEVMQQTTHAITPLIIVNGPIRGELGLASGTGALGPGHRANASIGRALRLILINVGGGRVGEGDMAILGSPAKFAMCVAEAEEDSPFEPLNVARGFSADQSTVTVIPVEGPHVVHSLRESQNAASSADRILAAMANALGNIGSPSTYNGQGNVAALFNPDHAHILAGAGLTRRAIQERLWRETSHTHAQLKVYGPGMVQQEGASDDQIYTTTRSPDDIVVAVCGAAGGYSVAMPTQGASPGRGLAITRPIRGPEVCEI